MTKEEAIVFILKVLKSPISMMSKPTSDQAFGLAKEYDISATELLEKCRDLAWKV